MEVLRDWRKVPASLRSAAYAIGNFDGVHRGHQALLDATRTAAGAAGIRAGVMLFEPHPRKFFQPDRPLFELTPLARKLELLALYGMEIAAVIPFDAEMAERSAEAFVDDVLVGGFSLRHAVVGFDFFFGKAREGNPSVLSALGKERGFAVTVVDAVGGSGETFSSTRVRELLAEGDPRGAAEILGYWWRVKGIVESGARRGTGLGFPTANIVLEDAEALHHGIYAVRVYSKGSCHYGAAYLGTRPTFDAGPPVLEVFLLDYDDNLYGQELEVEFIAYLRDDARFRSAESLVEQMRRDCERARAVLDETETDDPMMRFALGRALLGKAQEKATTVSI